MQDSPQLRDATSFVGRWRLTGANAACEITLSQARVESANAHRLTEDDNCLSRLLGQAVAGWRPAPDGLDFAGPDRLSVGFFSFEGEGAVLTLPTGPLTLSRVV